MREGGGVGGEVEEGRKRNNSPWTNVRIKPEQQTAGQFYNVFSGDLSPNMHHMY